MFLHEILGCILHRNFELKHIGQIKTVYPTAYELRQEKGLPMFGSKTSDYQLTVEAKLDEGQSVSLNFDHWLKLIFDLLYHSFNITHV